jgi:predicted AAA+ superfamily ATPase
LSGSATPKYIGSLHSGAGRISIIEMENLTLQEMNFVEKKVNFMNLFCKDFHVEKINEFNDNENGKSIFSNIVNMVKGGFPKNYVDNLDEERCINKNKKYIASITRCYEEREGVKPLINFSRPTMVSVIYEISRNTGQAINYEKLAKNIGIAPKTFRKYISILEEMHLIYFLEP